MPGLVQGAVKYRAVQRAWEEGADGRPYSWPSCWTAPPSTSSSPSHEGAGIWWQPLPEPPPGATPLFSGHTKSHAADSEKNTNNLLDFK